VRAARVGFEEWARQQERILKADPQPARALLAVGHALEAAAERLTPGELRERLSAIEPAKVRERPSAALRAERDSR